MRPRESRPPRQDIENSHALDLMNALISLEGTPPDEVQRGLLEAEAENVSVTQTARSIRGVITQHQGYFYTDPQTGVKTELSPDLASKLLAYKRVPEENFEVTLPRDLVEKGEALVDEIAKVWSYITPKRLEGRFNISKREAAALFEQLQISGHISYQHKEGLGYVIGKFDTREAPRSPKDRTRGRKILELATTERTRLATRELWDTKKAQKDNLRRKVGKFAGFVTLKNHQAKNQRTQDEIDAFNEQKRKEEARRQNPRWHTTIE